MFRLRDGPAPPLRPMVASDGRMHSTGEQPLDHIASVHHTHSACFARCLDNGLSMKTVAKRVLRRCRHLSSGTDDGAVVGLEPVSYTHLRAHETDTSLFVGSVRCV